MTASGPKTLRLLMPQWQGGNNPAYHFGAKLLAWLAPAAAGPVEEVPVAAPGSGALSLEDGIVGRSVLLRQLRAASDLIRRHEPDAIVALGGDCLVDLAPIAYLNDRYDGDLAVLWIDAHPDVMTPREFSHAHAMVLGNLLGFGDPAFVAAVPRKLDPGRVLFAGVHGASPVETAFIAEHGIRRVGPEAIARSSEPILQWLEQTGASRVAVHLDLDVLDPALFHALLFNGPEAAAGALDGVPTGRLTLDQVTRLLGEVAARVSVVGLAITEHMPWDAAALAATLGRLPLLGTPAPAH